MPPTTAGQWFGLFTVGLLAACQMGNKTSGSQRSAAGSVADGETDPTLPEGVAANPNEPASARAPVQAGIVGGPNNAYTLVGRFDTSQPDRLTFAFANSKVGARFVGSQLSVTLATSGNDTYDIAIDDRPSTVLAPPAAAATQPSTYLLANDLAPTTAHTVWLTKRTESNVTANDKSGMQTGACTFFGFSFGADGHFVQSPNNAAQILTPGTKSRLIEMVGDSAFTGYGVLQTIAPGQGNTCAFNPNQQDAMQSIPHDTAVLLDAEVLNISSAGKGILRSVYNTDPNSQMPTIYQKTVWPNAAPLWGFTDPNVAAVVVQAGSNDLAGAFNAGAFPDPNAFIATYAKFLADIRSHRPQAAIVSVITQGAQDQDKATLRNAFQAAIAQRTAAGETGLYLYDYFQNDPNGWTWYADASSHLGLGSGCEGHPSAAGASFLAGRLAAYLKTLPEVAAAP